mmetsp:Transcript_87457/g.183035  ORF Transcript_87457/g.183035 Transcript_87457/m.183035 type:complete len:467 (-) Transcript_87457:1779-3179(-)
MLLVDVPDCLELSFGILPDDVEDFLYIGRVEQRWLYRLCRIKGHQFLMVGIRKSKCSQNLEGRAANASLVCRCVFENVDSSLFQHFPSSVGQEKVGPFHDEPEFRLTALQEEASHIGGGNRVGPSSTRNEQISLCVLCQVEAVSELGSCCPSAAIWQSHIHFVDCHHKTTTRQLPSAEVVDGKSQLGEALELHAAQALGVVEDARAIHDAYGLILRNKDFVGAKISVGSTCLELRDLCLVFPQSSKQFSHVHVDTGSRHAVGVMGYAAKFHTFSSCQGLPVGIASGLADLGTEIHEVCCVFVGTEEQDLLVPLHVAIIDATLLRHHAVKERVDILGEASALRSGALGGILSTICTVGIWQNDSLRSTLWDVFVFHLLCECEVVGLVEQCGHVALVHRLISREHQANTSTCHIPEADMKSSKVSSRDEVDTIWHLWVQRHGAIFQDDGWVQAEGESMRCLCLEEVRQ